MLAPNHTTFLLLSTERRLPFLTPLNHTSRLNERERERGERDMKFFHLN